MRKPGVHTYAAQWPIASLAWTLRNDKRSRLAIGSVQEEYRNSVELLQFNPQTHDFTADHRLTFDHPFAATNLMFLPSEDSSFPDLIATSGEFLRLWRILDDRTQLKAIFDCNKGSEFSAPLTSFDWGGFDVGRIVTCSVDTTCTVWDTEQESVVTQLIAHDKEVYDVSWGACNVFATVSGDGSARVFDLRNRDRSTILYENCTPGGPLLRVEWNKCDPAYVAVVGMDSSVVVILDVRYPTGSFSELKKHRGSVNAVSWAPRGRKICSGGDDARALIWEVDSLDFVGTHSKEKHPEMIYSSPAVLNNVRWSPIAFDWIGVTFINKLQLLRV